MQSIGRTNRAKLHNVPCAAVNRLGPEAMGVDTPSVMRGLGVFGAGGGDLLQGVEAVAERC